jgi:RNA polymerase sigma factor (sigma-70 family)
MKTVLEQETRLLLSRCFTGDREAAEALVRQYSSLVYYAVRNTLLLKGVSFSNHDLEDLHNTVFLALFEERCKKLKQFEGRNGCSLASWIKLVAVRMVLDHLRRKGVDSLGYRQLRIPLEEVYGLREEEPGACTVMEREEQSLFIRETIKRLPARDQLFVKLYFDHGLPLEEVATIMNLTMNNLYTIKHRLIQKLRSQLGLEGSKTS